jgi:hypothetical protein
LVKEDYGASFRALDTLVKQLDSEKNGNLLKLIEVLTTLLREEHVVKMVRKAYACIEQSKLMALLGITEWQANDMNALYSRIGFTVIGDGFVYPSPVQRGDDTVAS